MPTSPKSSQSPSKTSPTGGSQQQRRLVPGLAADGSAISGPPQGSSVVMAAAGRKRSLNSEQDEAQRDDPLPAGEDRLATAQHKRQKTGDPPPGDDSATDSVVPAETSEGGEGVTRVEDVSTCFKRTTTDTRQLYNRWQEQFGEIEAFELFCPARVDELLKGALALEQNVIREKDKLRARLVTISKTFSCL